MSKGLGRTVPPSDLSRSVKEWSLGRSSTNITEDCVDVAHFKLQCIRTQPNGRPRSIDCGNCCCFHPKKQHKTSHDALRCSAAG